MLQYPLKPIPLSDDLESFVYVVVQCALRYHAHNMGRAIPLPSSLTKDQLATHNLIHGSRLAEFASSLFYQEFDEVTHTLGGDTKFERITYSSPGFKLKQPKGRPLLSEHPLQRLLNDLYSLLHEHYAALDIANLGWYKSEESEFLEQEPATRAFCPDLDEGELDEPTLVAAKESPSAATIASLATQRRLVKWQGAAEPRLVLEDHQEILRIFTAVITGKSGRPLVFKDKTEDQLYGTSEIVKNRPTGCTGTASKRKSEATHEGRDAKHARIGETSAQSLDTVGEDEQDPPTLPDADNVGDEETETDLTDGAEA